ncbi:TetR/AcrR family transcriptional regulator [Bisbaumannia pacifica]|uniref:Transcriptional regulator n=2 Tax=Bisbaumannia pacifica TaxID=77098 RepID=A0A510X9D7_9GAMM|nr:TetR/AcrR family transcriptional regulator [Halomonas pacifica]MBH8579524.1 TetR/AcrR family transcriptional regulator [Halomonas pacifica]GEK47307.1 transcriptional regulator [Halomonas pacifica]
MRKRLSKDERRQQLLDLSLVILERDGADVLTLATLAQEAGVTKPVAYSHFQSRANLLYQLYARFDQRLVDVTRQRVAGQARSLQERVHHVVALYFDCVRQCGPQYEAIVSALMAYPEYKDIRTDIRNSFVRVYRELFSDCDTDGCLSYRLVAIFGAIEEVAKATMENQVPYDQAVGTLERLIISALQEA